MSKIVSVVSGKGGVGKSAVCVFLAAALAKMGQKVLLVETDTGLRGLDIMLGLENQAVFDLSDVLQARCEPIRAIIRCPDTPNVSLLPASANPDFKLDSTDFTALVNGLATCYDFVLIDTCAGFSANFSAAIAPAETVLLVATPDPICVRDAGIVMDRLSACRVPEVRLIINKVPRSFPKNSMISDLDQVIDLVGAQLIGVVPEDMRIVSALSQGAPSQTSMEIQLVFENIAHRLLGRYVTLLFG